MIVKDKLLNQLKTFGLNSYEAKLWMALLSKGVATAGELSDIANVPRSRSYDVLESLEKKGFIMMKLGKPIKYVSVKPSEVLDRVKRKIEQEAMIQSDMVDKIKESDIFDELKMLHTQGIETIEPGELTGSIKGRVNIYDHLSSSIKNAENEVYVMTSTQGLKRKADALKRAFSKAHKKSVKVRLLAPIDESVKDVVSQLKEFVEIRHVDKIKSRFVVIDQKELTFMLMDDQTINSKYDTAVWVNTAFFSSTVVEFFNKMWERSLPVEEVLAEDMSSQEKIAMTE